jgi:hypothetical protein
VQDREEDGLGSHVHFAAAGAGGPDGGHVCTCIGLAGETV